MTSAEIIAAIRRDLREPTPITVSNTQISDVVTLGVDRLWEALIEADSRTGRERVSLSSYSNVFSIPSDVLRIGNVWDMNTTAKSVTAATNADPIVITSASHGFTDADILRVHGVLGNTAANGTWQMNAVDDNSFELLGAVGNAAWTSGGKIYKEKSTFRELREITTLESTFRKRWHYYIRGSDIVVDWTQFSNDLILDYIRNPDNGIDDVPAKYHVALVSYAVLQLARPISQEESNATDLNGIITYHQNRYSGIMESLNSFHNASSGPKYTPDTAQWDSLY